MFCMGLCCALPHLPTTNWMVCPVSVAVWLLTVKPTILLTHFLCAFLRWDRRTGAFSFFPLGKTDLFGMRHDIKDLSYEHLGTGTVGTDSRGLLHLFAPHPYHLPSISLLTPLLCTPYHVLLLHPSISPFYLAALSPSPFLLLPVTPLVLAGWRVLCVTWRHDFPPMGWDFGFVSVPLPTIVYVTAARVVYCACYARINTYAAA